MLRNKILYLLFLLETGALCILYNAYLPVLLLQIALMIPVVLLLELILAGRKVHPEVLQTRYVVERGQGCEVIVDIHCNTFLPIGLIDIDWRLDQKRRIMPVYMGSSRSLRVPYCISGEQCGCRTVEIEAVYLYDILKIFRKKYILKKKVEVLITPKLYSFEQDVSGKWDGGPDSAKIYRTDRPGDDPSEVFDIRDYREGDRLSRIHWKLSYKMNRYLVREFSETVPEKVDIIFVAGCSERCKDVLFSLGYRMLAEGRRVVLNGVSVEQEEEFLQEFIGQVEKASGVLGILEDMAGGGISQSARSIVCVDGMTEHEQTATAVLCCKKTMGVLAKHRGEECENMDQGVLCVLDEMSVEMAMERLIHG
ncbi:MAG: DUF58 domain-containing protein [Lachnospiraceae bacterium]